MSDWKSQALSLGVPVFPVRLTWNGEKWDKVPLTNHGHLDATTEVDNLDWSRANGIGIPMGGRLYALDIDDYDPECQAYSWIEQRSLPKTRLHQTVSGGKHAIYQLSPGYENLPNRRGIVPGLDARGQGGWIVFGEGYTVLQSVRAALLPTAVCDEIWEGWRGSNENIDTPEPDPVDPAVLRLRLENELMFNPGLAKRWQNFDESLNDTSRSGRDYSLANILAKADYTYSEIVWILEHEFPHGTAKGKGPVKKNLDRELRRNASKALKNKDAQLDAALKYMGVSND